MPHFSNRRLTWAAYKLNESFRALTLLHSCMFQSGLYIAVAIQQAQCRI